jgi:adenylate cyclase
MQQSFTKKIVYGALIGGGIGILVLMVSQWLMPGTFRSLEAKTLDWRYYKKVEHLWTQREGNPIEDIVIIDIDNRSLDKLGRYNQWPRTYHARIADYVASGGAAALAFDILFMEPDANPGADEEFANATQRAGNVVHSLSFSQADPDAFLYVMNEPPDGFDAAQFSFEFPQEVLRHFALAERFEGKVMALYNGSAALGFANFLPDEDSVIRTMPMFINFAGRVYPSLALAAVMKVTGAQAEDISIALGEEIRIGHDAAESRALRIPIDENGRVLINYMGTFKSFRYVSFYDVLEQRLPAEMFADKIVLVGTSASGLVDLRPVPFQPDFPGVEIHANIIYDILTQDFIRKQSAIPALAIFIGICILAGVLAMILHPLLGILIALILAAGDVALAFYLFVQHNLWIEEVRPLVGLGVSLLAVTVYRYLDEEKEKRRIKGMFANYTSASMVDELLKNPAMLKLGGERMYATAFFSDIKNFTTVSERLTPEALVMQLNEYLSAMTDVVLRYEGYLDKYEGDAVMAVFGVPVSRADHAARASFAALDMQELLHSLREKWRKEDRPLFEARMGMNSGPMIAGNIGGKDRFDYTVIGDAVNLASRLEGANKMYGTGIMMSEETYALVKDLVHARELDFIRVKGKTKPVRVFELLAKRDRPLPQEIQTAIEHFARGLEYYRRMEWVNAVKAFQQVYSTKPEDGPTQEFLRRCEIFLQSPRPKDWDGVFEMRTK